MSDLNPNQIAAEYKMATPLKDTAFQFGNSELIEKYHSTEFKQPDIKSTSVLGILSEGIQGLQSLGIVQKSRDAIYKKLELDIIAQIQNGELIALGLELPINAKSEPAQISAHLFSGDINWENSELKFKSLEFSGIRVFKPYLNTGTKTENTDAKIPISDPNQLVDENIAASLLGISPRTLQKYRGNGKGPKFVKVGKSVRYKISVINDWIAQNGRINTIN